MGDKVIFSEGIPILEDVIFSLENDIRHYERLERRGRSQPYEIQAAIDKRKLESLKQDLGILRKHHASA